MKVVTAAQMREIESNIAASGVSLASLMERAGLAVAEAANQARHGGSVLVLVGPGNNGGDGLVAARHLYSQGCPVTAYTYRRRKPVDFAGPTIDGDADDDRSALRALQERSDVIVDALLGIGQTRAAEGELGSILECINSRRPGDGRAIAVDIPTGVNADTGNVLGMAFKADQTLAFGFLKCGNVLYPGAEYGGRVTVASIGMESFLVDDVGISVPVDHDIAALLPTRGLNANKGSGGRLLFVGGSRDFLGAPALSALAAYKTGAGLVEIATPLLVQQTIAAHALEPVYSSLPDVQGQIGPQSPPVIRSSLERANALVFGPGMGFSDTTGEVTRQVLDMVTTQVRRPAVFDADALNALASIAEWWKEASELVLTPHPGEMARLTGLSIPEIQSDRLKIAVEHAVKWGVIVVLKGAGTVVASPSGHASINPTGGPNLATAGTGDVLSGIIGGLLAQGCEPFEAAIAGVYMHGRAGDILRAEHGDVGTLAGELLPVLPRARLSILKGAGQSP